MLAIVPTFFAALVIIAMGAFPPLECSGQRASRRPLAATREQPFVNSLGMKFMRAGTTQVLFCIHDVHRRATMSSTWRIIAKSGEGADSAPRVKGQPLSESVDHPAVNVSWEDAQRPATWLNPKRRSKLTLAHGSRVELGSGHRRRDEDPEASPARPQ